MINHDLQLNKFFLKKDLSRIVTDISELKYAPLDKNIYFRPSNCPLINVADSNLGTCFADYIIPTGSIDVYQSKQIPLKKDLSLFEYTNNLYNKINDNIKSIFDIHDQVMLCYSGGIDSLVLLSYIINLGLVNRIKFVINNNTISKSNGCLYYNPSQKQLTLKLAEQLGISIEWLDITEDDLIFRINNRSMEHVKTYSISCLFDKFKDSAFIGGWHGNQVLLHKYVFWDEIRLMRPSAEQEILDFLKNNSNFYTSSLKHYNINKEIIPIERVHMLQKPWDWFNNINGNRLYSPLANNETFQMLRRIEFANVPIETIAHASVATEIIDRNVGNLFSQYITHESIHDGDSLGDIGLISIGKINQDILQIPKNLNHSNEGLIWIMQEIESAKINGVIPFNSVMALKTLHWLSSL